MFLKIVIFFKEARYIKKKILNQKYVIYNMYL